MSSVLTHLPATAETVGANWIVVDKFKLSKKTFISIHILANRNSYHGDKYEQQCSTRTFFPNWSEMCGLHVLTFLQSIITHPVKFRYTTGEIAEYMMPRCVDINLSIVDMDFQYR